VKKRESIKRRGRKRGEEMRRFKKKGEKSSGRREKV